MTLVPGQSFGKGHTAGEILACGLQALLSAEQEKTQAPNWHGPHNLTSVQAAGPGPQLGDAPILRDSSCQPWSHKAPGC